MYKRQLQKLFEQKIANIARLLSDVELYEKERIEKIKALSLIHIFQGDRKTVALYQWAGYQNGKCIACAGIVCGQVGTRYFPIAVSLSVIGVNGSFARISLYGHACDNNDTGAVLLNCMQVSF